MESTPAPILDTTPKSWRDLGLLIAWTTFRDIHVKGAALVFLGFGVYGIFHPEYKDACQQTLLLAGTYGFAAALKK